MNRENNSYRTDFSIKFKLKLKYLILEHASFYKLPSPNNN